MSFPGFGNDLFNRISPPTNFTGMAPGAAPPGAAPGAVSPFDGQGTAQQLIQQLMAYQPQQFDQEAFDTETATAIDDYKRQSRGRALMEAGAALLATAGDPARGLAGAASAFSNQAGQFQDFKHDYTAQRDEQARGRSREGFQDELQRAYAATSLIPQATPPEPELPSQDQLDRQQVEELLRDPQFIEQIRARYPDITDAQIQALAMDPVAMRQYLQPPEAEGSEKPPAASELMGRIRLSAMQGDPDAQEMVRNYGELTSQGGELWAQKMFDTFFKMAVKQYEEDPGAFAAAAVDEAQQNRPGGGGAPPASGGNAEADAKRLKDAGISAAQATQALQNDYPGEDVRSIIARLWGRSE